MREHPGAQVHPLRGPGEPLDSTQHEPRPAADFQDVAPFTEALHEAGLELVEELVIAPGVVFAAVSLVRLREGVIIRAVRFLAAGSVHVP